MDLRNLPYEALETWFEDRGQPRFRADQVFRWMYAGKGQGFDAMTNLPKALREELAQQVTISHLEPERIVVSEDGTRKYRFLLADGKAVETVFIPDEARFTLCISTQAGCAMGCTFCHTGRMKLLRNLCPAEIVNQVIAVAADVAPVRITNIVLMGMGEPLHNYDNVVAALRILLDSRGLDFSHRKVTLSTVGLVPELRRLGQELPVNLAVSLHAARDELRTQIVPLNKKYPLAELIAACRDYPIPPRKRITFEYVQLPGVNDTPRDVEELVTLLAGLRCKINIIPFNPFPGAPYRAPEPQEVIRFERALSARGFHVLVRTPRGRDVLAACGQLADLGEGRAA